MTSAVLLSAILVLIGAVEALGQEPIEIESGSRVRVHGRGGVVWIGTLLSADSARAHIDPDDGGPVFVDRARIERVQVSTGRGRPAASTALKVGGVITLLGGVAGAVSYRPCVPRGFLDCLFSPDSRAQAFLMGGMLGAVVALPVGLLFGLSEGDVWRDGSLGIPTAPQDQFSLTPVIGSEVGVLLRVSVPW